MKEVHTHCIVRMKGVCYPVLERSKVISRHLEQDADICLQREYSSIEQVQAYLLYLTSESYPF